MISQSTIPWKWNIDNTKISFVNGNSLVILNIYPKKYYVYYKN